MNVLLLFQDPFKETTLRLVVMAPQTSLVCEISQSLVVFMTLTVLSSGHITQSMSPNLDLCDVFLMVRLDYGFGGNHREVPLLSHYVREYPKSTEHHSQEISLDIYTV